MSILTKVFVVLVAIAGSALAGMSAAIVANIEPKEQQVKKIQDERDKMASELKVIRNDLAEFKAHQGQERAAASQTQLALNNHLSSLRTELSTERSEKRKAQDRVAEVEAQLKAAVAAGETFAAAVSGLQSQVGEMAGKQVALETQNVKLQDSVHEAQGARDHAVRQIERVNEEKAALQADNSRLSLLWSQVPLEVKERVTGRRDEGRAPAVSAPSIRGLVQDVRTTNGTTVLQINLGSRDHLTPNMKLMVVSADSADYCGDLVLSKVDVDKSVGTMTDKARDVKVGDRVVGGTN